MRTRRFSQENLPLAAGGLEWADSVTGQPKAELLHIIYIRVTGTVRIVITDHAAVCRAVIRFGKLHAHLSKRSGNHHNPRPVCAGDDPDIGILIFLLCSFFGRGNLDRKSVV